MSSGLSAPSAALSEHGKGARGLADSYAACKRITAHHARSFYYASPFLPAAKRNGAYAVYAFCRVADDTVDRAAEIGTLADVQVALATVDRLLQQAYGLAPAEDAPAWMPAFADTVARFKIPHQVFADLMDGVRMDLPGAAGGTGMRGESFDGLLEYCHKVAGVVGVMMTHIFGFESETILRQAAAMGVAMQLTNISRDVAEDAKLGRVYLPAEWLAEAGLTSDDILHWPAAAGAEQRAKLERVMRRLIETARRYYQYAFTGVPGITDPLGRLCTLAMGGIYGDILLALEKQNADPFAGRARRSGGQKVRRMVGLVLRFWNWLPARARALSPWPQLAGDVRLWWPDLCGPAGG